MSFQNFQFDESINRLNGRTYTTPLFDNTLTFWMREKVMHLVKILVLPVEEKDETFFY